MNLHSLTPAEGSIKQGKRIGRGQGSGRGGTSTKGHKGAQSRTGYSRKQGFEGGQMPLQRRLPKFGFKNRNRVAYTGINLDRLQRIADKLKVTSVDMEILYTNRIISKTEKVKILGGGELTSKIDVKVSAYTLKAKEAIEKAGGTTEIV
jgi:large subunit ribosomal protein L15